MLCIQFMAVTVEYRIIFRHTRVQKSHQKKARKCSIEIRRVEFYFFRPKRTESRQMLAKTSFFIYVFKTSTKSWPETTIQNPSNGGYDAKKCVYKNDK